MTISANQLAALLSGTIEGDGNVQVETIAKIEEAHPKALAFLGNPKIIFFDEPTVGLDLKSRAKFYQLIKFLSSEHKTSFVITTHNVL